jgi:hypothetical protein
LNVRDGPVVTTTISRTLGVNVMVAVIGSSAESEVSAKS